MTETLYRVVFPHHEGSKLKTDPIVCLRLEETKRYVNDVNGARVEPDGILTTIREYCAGNPSLLKESCFSDRDLDAPVHARVYDNESRVFCSGRVIAAFYWQPERRPHDRSRCWPAYLSFDERTGLRLVQSA